MGSVARIMNSGADNRRRPPAPAQRRARVARGSGIETSKLQGYSDVRNEFFSPQAFETGW